MKAGIETGHLRHIGQTLRNSFDCREIMRLVQRRERHQLTKLSQHISGDNDRTCMVRPAMNHPMPDGGRRIVIITARIIGFREQVNMPRTYDYPFSMFQMQFDKAGKGEGRMAYATQINFDKKNNSIELENYSSEPVRHNNLELEVWK